MSALFSAIVPDVGAIATGVASEEIEGDAIEYAGLTVGIVSASDGTGALGSGSGTDLNVDRGAAEVPT